MHGWGKDNEIISGWLLCNVKSNFLRDTGGIAIGEGLKVNSTLKELCLDVRNKWAIVKNKNGNFHDLKTLDLSAQNISDISAIRNNTQLEILRLSRNNISEISPLMELTNLKELALWQNKISDITLIHPLIFQYVSLTDKPLKTIHTIITIMY